MVETLTAFFSNINNLIDVIYEGILLIIGGVLLVSVLKELIPAIFDARKRESMNFKERITSVIIGIGIYILAALAPVWIPLAVDFFGGLVDFGKSITNVTGQSS